MPSQERRARALLRWSSWTMLSLFGLLFLGVLVPPFGKVLSSKTSSFTSVLGVLSGVAIAFAMLGSWFGGIWHAAVHQGFRAEGQRVAVIVMLLLSSTFGGMGYYFGYVRWIPDVAA